MSALHLTLNVEKVNFLLATVFMVLSNYTVRLAMSYCSILLIMHLKLSGTTFSILVSFY